MENKVMGWCLLILGLLGCVTSALATSNDLPCPRALSRVLPCLGFLTGRGMSPSPRCCQGLQEVVDEATSTQIRRDVCECFKKAAIRFGVQADRSIKLGSLCKVDLPVPLDPTVDCSTVPA